MIVYIMPLVLTCESDHAWGYSIICPSTGSFHILCSNSHTGLYILSCMHGIVYIPQQMSYKHALSHIWPIENAYALYSKIAATPIITPTARLFIIAHTSMYNYLDLTLPSPSRISVKSLSKSLVHHCVLWHH